MLNKLKSTVSWFLRGMPLNVEEQETLRQQYDRMSAAAEAGRPFHPGTNEQLFQRRKSVRVSPRKITAGQLMLPEYADTRERAILDCLMTGGRFTLDVLAYDLRARGHATWHVSPELSTVRGCLRRSCIDLQKDVIRYGKERLHVHWLSPEQRQAVREEADRLINSLKGER